MSDGNRTFLVCNCEKTMPLDGDRLGKALGLDGPLRIHTNLCRTEMPVVEAHLGTGDALMIACTQEASLFREIAEDSGAASDPYFVNIRERAGWCATGADPNPKIAALVEEALFPVAPAGLKTIRSDGLCLVYGAGQQALDVARALEGRLSVSLVLTDASDVVLPSVMDVPVNQGRIVSARGSLGAFEITVDGYAAMLPSSRSEPAFQMARDSARSQCSLILDLSGGTPLFSGDRHRDGYMRVDPGDPAAVARAMFEISDMVGTFEKPLYVHYDADICAHSRSQKVGCSKCLDACPAGAIEPDGDNVRISPEICGGCGSCNAHCPTGAVSYHYPDRRSLIGRLQVLLSTYLKAGGKDPVVLFHDEQFGAELITAMARHCGGLPVNVLPVALHAATATGHEIMIAAIAAGADHVAWLSDPRHADETAALQAEIDLAASLTAGISGHAAKRFHLLLENDPDRVLSELGALGPQKAVAAPTFMPVGDKRGVARTALNALRSVHPDAPDCIDLPGGAPYGRISIATNGCTLCLACVSACPASALSDNPDRPMVALTESACVQCGLCANTCPENVITLTPRYDFRSSAMTPEVLNEEEPATCKRCGKVFGTKSTIARIREKLEGRHWMFQDQAQADLIEMCDDCRVEAQWEIGGGPMAAGSRPRTRTTEDYLDARDDDLDIDDFLIKD